LFEHIQSEVDFDTIEGKTQFLEKASELIKSINYEVYQQQLITGIAQIVGQSIEQVMLVFIQQKTTPPEPEPVYFDNQYNDEDMREVDYSEYTNSSVDVSPKSTNMKVLMSKMITFVLNYPTLADATIEVRVRVIENSQVLLELVRSAQIDENISQSDLIKPFENKTRIFNRLKQLCILEPHLSELQAKEEFLAILNNIEKQQNGEQIKHSIHHAHTLEEQQKIMQEILKSKQKT
jgi:DNA primase